MDFTVCGILQAKILEWVSLLQGLFPTQGLNPDFPHMRADSLPAEPQGKPKPIGVGSLSLLQRIFLTQGSNQRLSSPAFAGGFFTTSTTWEAP